MEIRKASKEKIVELLEMYDELYKVLRSYGMPFELNNNQMKHILEVQLESKMYNILIAEDCEESIGFISASISKIDRKLVGGMIGTINDIYVHNEARGRGIASALLSETEEWFRRVDVRTVKCDIVVKNDSALGFWRSHGYLDMSISALKSL